MAVRMHSPEVHAANLADSVSLVLQAARTVVEQQAALDLAGLDWDVGRLCAACLDLPPEQGRALRGRLQALAEELDALRAAVVEAGP
jgi:uncharacterized protein (DUF1778 family)